MSCKIVLTIPILFIMFLFFPKNVFGQKSQFGYRVTQPGKTVIQIARDVYNDERQWKKIAYWNNLTPPYALSVGQILVLPMQPKLQLSQKNLVAGAEVPAPQFLQQLPSVSRVIWDRNGYYVYEVNERAPSLSMVALENYGDKNMVKLIARWNGLAANEHLSLGQKLIFHEKPTLTGTQSNAVLVKEWARVGNEVMVQRLSGKTLAPTFETAKPTQAPNTDVEKSQVETKAQPETTIQHAPASVQTAPQVEVTSPVQTAPRVEATSPVQTNPTVQAVPKVETQTTFEPAPAKAEAPPALAPAPNTAEIPAKIVHPDKKIESVAVPQVEAATPVKASESKSTSSKVNPSIAVPAVAVPSLPSVPGISAPSLPSIPSLPSTSTSKSSPSEPVRETTLHGSTKLPEKKVESVVTEPVNLGKPLNTMETQTPTPTSNVLSPIDDPELQPVYQNSGTSVPVSQPVETVQPVHQNPIQTPSQVLQQQATPQTVQQPTPPTANPTAASATAPASTPAAAPTPAAASAPTPVPTQAVQTEEPERKPSSTTTDPAQMPEPTSESYWLGSDTMRIMKTLSKPNGK